MISCNCRNSGSTRAYAHGETDIRTKTGKAANTVKCTDGTTLTCEITVKANKFTGRKITLSNVLNDRYGFEAYSASFDKKGNLVVKARYANNSSLRILEIRNLKVTVKDVNGKKVGKK